MKNSEALPILQAEHDRAIKLADWHGKKEDNKSKESVKHFTERAKALKTAIKSLTPPS